MVYWRDKETLLVHTYLVSSQPKEKNVCFLIPFQSHQTKV